MTTAPTTATSAPVRDGLLDNARAVLIVLVVYGHLVMTYHNEAGSVAYAHYFIYLFHMPAFAYLSGYVVKSPRRAADKAIMALLPLYLGFSVVHLVARRLFYGEWEWTIVIAPGLLWYLLALLLWRLLLPVMDALRWPVAISILASLAVSMTDRFGPTLALSRTVVFLPFFLMGYYTRKETVERLRSMPWIVGVAAVVPVAAVAWLATTRHSIRLGLLTGYSSYADIPGRTYAEMLGRLVVVGCTVLMLVAILRLVPRRHTFWSHVGQYSLGVYVLHMYAIYAFDVWHPTMGDIGFLDTLVFLTPIPIAFVLASRPARAFVDVVERSTRGLITLFLKPVQGDAPERPAGAQEPSRSSHS